ncbi:MAG: hypothetical protein DWH90_00935 [Planctomycetota bacterium]|nr:MAG: hypothetical protein DWH90_00935 [Planctomycetota bacterium]
MLALDRGEGGGSGRGRLRPCGCRITLCAQASHVHQKRLDAVVALGLGTLGRIKRSRSVNPLLELLERLAERGQFCRDSIKLCLQRCL